jgi:micrococcal nuclease
MLVTRHFRRRLLTFSVSTVGFFISSFSAVLALDFTGPVVSVLDGDTLEVLHTQRPERIRLSGIDCPEKSQAYSKRAKQAASALAFGKEVTLQTHGFDKYGRTLADVLLPDGTNLNHSLVKDGWCWWYRKYAPGDTVLEWLEKETREKRRKACGLIRSRCRRGSGERGHNGSRNENYKSNWRFQGKYDRRRCWLRDCNSDYCITSVNRVVYYRFVRLMVPFTSSSPPFKANVTGLKTFSD